MEEQAFFVNANSFRDWLKKNHLKDIVLWVCYYKKHTKKPSITWDESVTEALCFGWIDGLRKSIDDESYKIRFTQRRKTSIWSKKNIETVKKLIKQKRMMHPGIQAFKLRKEHKSAIYSYETLILELSKEYNDSLQREKNACDYYNSLSPSAKKHSINWIMSAEKQATRDRRFSIFLESCSAKKLIPVLKWSKKNPED